MINQNSIFNENELVERLLGDKELAREILMDFLSDVPKRIDRLKIHQQAGDAEQVRREAHAIKGAAANMGAAGLKEAAYEIETAGASADIERAAALLPGLDKEFALLKEHVDNIDWD